MSRSRLSALQPKRTEWKAHLADWAKYTAAAGAALSMATSADAGIISGNPNITISSPNLNGFGSSQGATNQAATFGLGGAAIFLDNASQYSGGGHVNRSAWAGVTGLHFFAQGFPGGYLGAFGVGLAQKFNSGQSIAGGSQRARVALRQGIGRGSGHSQNAFGNFGFNTTGIVGFTAFGGDLGWLTVKLGDRNSDGYADQLTILAWAYNDVPGQSITAGQAPPSGTPEPGTAALSLLAAGAAGIVALRRRRKAVSGS